MNAQGIQRVMELKEFETERGPQEVVEAEVEDELARAFETDPLAWQDPDYAPPYTKSLVERFLERSDGVSLLDKFTEVESAATPEFMKYAMALWEQMFRDQASNVPAVASWGEFRLLSPVEKSLIGRDLDRLLETVFNWMTEQGMKPVTDAEEWETILTPQVQEILADLAE